MITVLLAAWLLGGLLLALAVGAAVRIADERYELSAALEPAEARAPLAV